MEETSTQTSWFQDAMKKGLLLGVIHIFIFVILYVALPGKLAGFSYLTVILVLNIGYLIFQGRQWRNQVGGFLLYGAAFKYLFILLVFNGLIYIVFSAVFLLIDPSLPQVMAQAQLDTSIYWAEKFGAPEASIDQIKEKFDFEEIEKRYSYSGMLLGFGVALIFYAIGAFIVGFIARKEQPVEF